MILSAEDADFVALANGEPVQGRPVAPGGIAPAPVMDMLRGLANRIRSASVPAGWWIVESDEIVGLCSITDGPSGEGVIDIGYGVAESRRDTGAATRAVADILSWARSSAEIAAVTAETSVENPASQRVLERNGFARIGGRTDAEDGDLICWRVSTGR